MKKHLLKKTKANFAEWFNQQPNNLRYELMTTSFKSKNQLAHFRRTYIKFLNDRNIRELKS